MLKSFGFLVLLFILFYLPVHAQIHGKLFSKDEADRLFGPVIESVSIPTLQMKSFVNKAPKVMLFKIINKNIVILSEKRKFIHSTGLANFTENETFHMYSTSKVSELIELGKSDSTIVQKREKVLTITNGATTLEMGTICPPYCD